MYGIDVEYVQVRRNYCQIQKKSIREIPRVKLITKTKLLCRTGIMTGVTYGFLWTFLEVSEYFGWNPLKNMGVMGHLWLISISLYVGMFLTVIYYFVDREKVESERETPTAFEKEKVESEKETPIALFNYVRAFTKSGDYSTLIRFGVALSRPLWLQGEYKARIAIGQIVEDAAARIDNKKAQATALIDDLGWTYVALKQFEEAEKNIQHGKGIASEISNHYLVARALRHLAGMAIERNALDNAIDFCNQAIKEAEKIPDVEDKEEMIAGIEYAFSVIFWMKNDLIIAKNYCLSARAKFEKLEDNERLAKTFSLLGKIGEKDGDLENAKDIYRRGLQFAEQMNIRDEIIRNHLGLARILLRQGQKATEHLNIAKNLSQSTPIVFEAATIDADLELLKRREL